MGYGSNEFNVQSPTAITDGAMMNTTGSVPNNIWNTLHRRIPAA
jgi:hypothetical protein